MKVLASAIIDHYQTNDPYIIAAKAEILLVKEPLGNVFGYYNNVAGQRFIHVNDNLPDYLQPYVVAHMLYRAFTNQDEMLFLKRKRAAHFTQTEREANKFATNLLIADEDMNTSVPEFLKKYGLSDADVEDLKKQLHSSWDPNKEIPFEDLFWQVVSYSRE